MRIFSCLTATIMLAGCAQPTRQLVQTYVPTAAYANYSCQSLSSEMQRIVRRYTELGGVQDENARGDTLKAGAGMITLPFFGVGAAAVAFVDGNDANTNQIQLLKGELDAAERAFIAQDCNNPMRVIRARG